MVKFIIRFRWFIIAACVIAGLAFATLIPLSKTDPEIRNYIPATLKSRIETDKIEKIFGVQDMIMILFRDSSIIAAPDLERIRSVDRGISMLSNVSDRISPFTVKNITSSDGMMKVDPLIERIPATVNENAELKKKISENDLARNVVVSSDFTTAAISVTLGNTQNETVTLHRIDSVIASYPGKAEVLRGGLPYIRQHIMRDVRRDGIILVPLALLIMLLILKLNLGEWKSVMMPFSVVLISTVICLGLIPMFGWKISIITLLVPVILIAVANNYGIYLVARYQEMESLRPGAPGEQVLRELSGSLNMPILFSGLTTIAGILGLLTHSVIPARQVGVLAAMGVSAALVMSLIMIPAMIYLRKKPYVRRSRSSATFSFVRLNGILARLISKYPGRIIVISALLTCILSAGIFLLRTETNQENYFPENSPVRQASLLINKKYGGSQTISVMVTGDIKDPAIMKGIDKLTVEVERMKGVGTVFSISKVVREMSKALYTSDEAGYDRIPGSYEGIAQMFELYNMSGDQSDFRQLMNPESTSAHILIRLSDPEKSVITGLKRELSALASSIPARVTIGGYAIIMADFAGSVIHGQVSSLIFALITVAALLAIVFRSLKGGIIGSIPLAASIIILFGFMGFAGIALDSATALLSSIMIGVGVDFTIQYVWCFNLFKTSGLSWEESTKAALETIGRSILINALSVMAGFSALMFSEFTSIRFFGYLVIISIGSCLLGALILIPAIIARFRPGYAARNMSHSKNKKDEKDFPVIHAPGAALTAARAASGSRSDYE